VGVVGPCGYGLLGAQSPHTPKDGYQQRAFCAQIHKGQAKTPVAINDNDGVYLSIPIQGEQYPNKLRTESDLPANPRPRSLQHFSY